MAKRKLVAIEILPVAKKDLQEIVDFIARGSIKYANLEKRLIIEAIGQLYYFLSREPYSIINRLMQEN
jgi:hypothetical protein